MRPLQLKGHERSITQVKYNREGDLLFSAAKDYQPSVWYSENGERLGTYIGHNGVIWCIDVTYDSKRLISGGGDNNFILWDCLTGTALNKLQAPVAVRTCGFSYSGNLFFFTTDQRVSHNCTLFLYDVRDPASLESQQAQRTMMMSKAKVTSAIWSHLDDQIITGHDNGEICQFDLRMKGSDPVNWCSVHKKPITDLQTSKDQGMLISSSKDQTARLFDTKTLEHIKTYKSERPVNSASISPFRDHIVLGGGEEAMQVTQTLTTQGGFEAKLFHLVFEEEFARVRGHFGPINSLAFHPNGESFVSGGEDGYVRLNKFDQDYYDFKFDF